MNDETNSPVPPGFIVLTHATGIREPLPIQRVVADWAWVADNNREVPFVDSPARILNRQYQETWAEVATLIAEAEAAERRARALPVMAAILHPVAIQLALAGGEQSSTEIAAAILDAIERLEATDV